MRFRSVVLLAAVGSFVSLVQSAVWFFYNAKIVWKSNAFGWLTNLTFVVFLCFLYFEASERIQSRARAVTAIVLLILTVLSALEKMWSLALGLYVSRHYHIFSSWDLLPEAFYLLQTFVWIVFLIAFSSKKTMALTRLIPTVSGLLALFNLGFAGWSSVQFYRGLAVDPHLATVWWRYVTLLFGWGTLFLFYARIWRRWKRDLTIQQNAVA